MTDAQEEVLAAVRDLRFVLEKHGLPVPRSFIFPTKEELNRLAEFFTMPGPGLGKDLRSPPRYTLMGIRLSSFSDK